MSRFFPHADYAEDQPLAHTILTSHVLYRGLQTGAFIGMPIAGFNAFRQVRQGLPRLAILSAGLRTVGVGSAVGTALMVPALMARMWGREEIEWKDRSWRLLANEGQKEVDDWSLIGTAVGAAVAWRRSGGAVSARLSLLRVTGGAGLGSLGGVIGYMVWRYGIHGGKR